MFVKLQESEGAAIGFQISDKVTTAEIDDVIEQLDQLIKEKGKIRLLVHMKGWHGMEPMAAFDDFHFLIRHIKDVEVLAVVGDRLWEKVWLGLSSLFIKGRSKYFEDDEYDFAWQWLKSVPPRVG